MFAKSVLVAALAAATLAASAEGSARSGSPRDFRITLQCKQHETGTATFYYLDDIITVPYVTETISCGESITRSTYGTFGRIYGVSGLVEVASTICLTGDIMIPGQAKCGMGTLKLHP